MASEPYEADAPPAGCSRHALRRFVEAQLHTRLQRRLFRERRIQRSADPDLMPPMLATRRLGEIREVVVVQRGRLLDELPANSRDDLPPPGVKQPGKIDAAGCRGAAELAAGLNEHRAHAKSSRLNGGDRAGGAAANHEDIG